MLFRNRLCGPICMAFAYCVAAIVSLVLTRGGDGIATMWPSSGILLAALLLAGPKRTPVYLIAAAVASMAANLITGTTFGIGIAFTFANLTEALIAARLCRGSRNRILSFTEPREVGRFCCAACIAGIWSAVTAGFLSGMASPQFILSWLTTVILGILIVTPLILTAYSVARDAATAQLARSSAEITTLLATMTIVSLLVFAQSTYPLLFLPMLVLLYSTYRLGPFGATAGVLIVAVIASSATALGRGPVTLIHIAPTGTILFLQFYLVVLLASALPLAALLAHRDDLVRKLSDANRRAEEIASAAILAADTDHLTGLSSRRKILADLELMMNQVRDGNGLMGVALLDIDHFKMINDRFGHQAGDVVLRRVADTILTSIRSGDAAGRFGGEEFLIAIPCRESIEAAGVAERVRRAVEASGEQGSASAHVTVSIGFASTSGDESIDELLERADRALYAAKAGGRNALRFAA